MALAEPIPFGALACSDADAVADFIERLHAHGFALLRFEAAAASEVATLRAHAAQFFALPAEAKRSIGDLHSVGSTYAGYRDSESIDAEFLEVHTTCNGTYPTLAQPVGMSGAAAALFRRLDDMSRQLLRLIATSGLGIDSEALLAPLDAPRDVRAAASSGDETSNRQNDDALTAKLRVCDGKRLDLSIALHGSEGAGAVEDEESVSASVLRVCHYRRRAAQVAAAVVGDVEVLFDEHTDSSLLTLSTLCPDAPGLQLRDAAAPDSGWLTVESFDGVSSIDIEVHVGDFLSFLSRDYFPSCVHRVTRPLSGPGRLSFPFLVRPRQEHVLDTHKYDPSGSNPNLVEVSGIPCSHLRKLFDARGKRLLDARREMEEREAARKARAKAFREATLAKLRAGALSDSSDAEEDTHTQNAPAATPPPSPPPSPANAADAARPTGDEVAVKEEAKVAPRPPVRAIWRLCDLGALHYSSDFLFSFKQHDLHLDHAEEPVTLQTQLNACYPSLADPKTAFGFRHVHQLDYATSGLLCVALNKKAAAAAGRLFEARRVDKLYLALVVGHVSWEHAACDASVGEDASDPRGFRMAIGDAPGCSQPRPAHTDLYRVARGYLQDQPVSKLLLRPSTGRRHQLRLHCLALGHGVVGDVAYTGDKSAERMMLHAWRLRMPLPPPFSRSAQPVCVATADPFACDEGDGRMAASMPLEAAVVELHSEGAFDTPTVLRQMRLSMGTSEESVRDSVSLRFRVIAPAGSPHATPRGGGDGSVVGEARAPSATVHRTVGDNEETTHDFLQWRSRRRCKPGAAELKPATAANQAAKAVVVEPTLAPPAPQASTEVPTTVTQPLVAGDLVRTRLWVGVACAACALAVFAAFARRG